MELHDGETIFDKMNTTYDKFRTTENNIAKVWEYYYELEQKNLVHREWPKPATIFRNLIIRDKNHDHLEWCEACSQIRQFDNSWQKTWAQRMALKLVTMFPCFCILYKHIWKNAEFDGGRMKSILYFCGLNWKLLKQQDERYQTHHAHWRPMFRQDNGPGQDWRICVQVVAAAWRASPSQTRWPELAGKRSTVAMSWKAWPNQDRSTKSVSEPSPNGQKLSASSCSYFDNWVHFKKSKVPEWRLKRHKNIRATVSQHADW